MINLGEGPDALYTVVRASAWRIFLTESLQGLAGGLAVAAVVCWATGRPALLAVALGGWVVGGIWFALLRNRAALELVEETVWGPAAPGMGREGIRLTDIDREAGYRTGRLRALSGWRRILSRSGREITFCRLWYDPSEMDDFLRRIGVDG